MNRESCLVRNFMGTGGMTRKLGAVLLMASLGLAGGLGGCVEAEEGQAPSEEALFEEGGPELGETTQQLSVANWTGANNVSASPVWRSQVAAIGNRVIMVHTDSTRQLYWRERLGVNTWSGANPMGLQSYGQRVSLAPFNGFLYMIYTDANDSFKLWVARFNPATNSWGVPFQISHRSFAGPPAMAAFNGVLQIIGVNPTDKRLWRATMSTSEAFTPEAPMAGHYSYSRVSAAVRSCKLYIAHRAGAGTNVVYSSFNGTSWTADQTIPAGPAGAPVAAFEPVIAERSGYLHLMYMEHSTQTVDRPLWWTYFNGTSWPSAVTVGTTKSYHSLALSTGGSGLVSAFMPIGTGSYVMEYAQSLPIRQPLPCVAPPG